MSEASWRRFWHAPDPPLDLALARILLAGTALWIVLSRPGLPGLLELPPELWSRVTPERRVRFLLLLPTAAERALWALLHVALASALLGLRARLACFMSGLLLYHFAPLESLIRSPNPYLRGLTIPTLGLLILSFSRCGDALALWPRPGPGLSPSGDYRWPLRLVQVLFCQIYVFAGYAKLATSGLAWTEPENLRGYLLLLNQALLADPTRSLGYAIAAHPWLCGAMAWAGLALEFAFPLVWLPRARGVLLAAAVLFHLANAVLLRIFFQNAVLLLLFVHWDGLRRRWRT